MAADSTVILLRARELEQTIQSVAFEMLREDGAYDKAQQLIVVASDVAKLTVRLDEVLAGRGHSSADTMQQRVARKATRSRRAGAKYPVFFVSGDRLVKLGKGKQKTAKEYRHEATRSSFEVVARWIESTTLSGSREWLAQKANEDLSGQVPSYQIYLIVSALQSIGAVSQVRRGQYSLDGDTGQPDVWWQSLEALPVPEAREDDE